ncbi:PE domain-containing protein, partial [Mycobacterium tuberculosis]|uniref:PE domain-containing protein n=1 Tax=Mycobacterium tuberculosis TaxID=1773 RepID=UPI0039F24933
MGRLEHPAPGRPAGPAGSCGATVGPAARARPAKSAVIVTPETVAAAASDVARIGSSIGAANAAAAG